MLLYSHHIPSAPSTRLTDKHCQVANANRICLKRNLHYTCWSKLSLDCNWIYTKLPGCLFSECTPSYPGYLFSECTPSYPECLFSECTPSYLDVCSVNVHRVTWMFVQWMYTELPGCLFSECTPSYLGVFSVNVHQATLGVCSVNVHQVTWVFVQWMYTK